MGSSPIYRTRAKIPHLLRVRDFSFLLLSFAVSYLTDFRSYLTVFRSNLKNKVDTKMDTKNRSEERSLKLTHRKIV